LSIKLVICKSLYYDARSEKHQLATSLEAKYMQIVARTSKL